MNTGILSILNHLEYWNGHPAPQLLFISKKGKVPQTKMQIDNRRNPDYPHKSLVS